MPWANEPSLATIAVCKPAIIGLALKAEKAKAKIKEEGKYMEK
jgi:hypothetical protein